MPKLETVIQQLQESQSGDPPLVNDNHSSPPRPGGLLLMVLSRGKLKALQAGCMSNLKQLAAASSSSSYTLDTGRPAKWEVVEYPGGNWFAEETLDLRMASRLENPGRPTAALKPAAPNATREGA